MKRNISTQIDDPIMRAYLNYYPTGEELLKEEDMQKKMDERIKRTFVKKSHNAVKLTENMAREMFNSGVRIIVRPAGRNTLERGAVYKRGEELVYESSKTADTFEQVIKDFAIGFGRGDKNNTFRYYLYMD